MAQTLRNKEISIGFLAERTGVAVSAIRFYEAEGLLLAERNAAGQRRFVRADVRRLSFIRILQDLGFPLARIREVLSRLPHGRTPNPRDWRRIATDIRGELDQRIETLERIRDNLDGCIGCGCLSLARCALYNPDDAARHKGKGARFLMGDSSEVKD
ncbi:MAG: redox-sensitive transcriptional activator SoxR [Boseongicola sp.]|nr:MAG: redox-sensitive transcriptional activator SoxR [Boseongicola sp.]